MPTPQILWTGKVSESTVRIRAAEGGGCVVEHLRPHDDMPEGEWDADVPDDFCAEVYLAAFLEARHHLDRLYERCMGNLGLKDGVTVLDDVAKCLRKAES